MRASVGQVHGRSGLIQRASISERHAVSQFGLSQLDPTPTSQQPGHFQIMNIQLRSNTAAGDQPSYGGQWHFPSMLSLCISVCGCVCKDKRSVGLERLLTCNVTSKVCKLFTSNYCFCILRNSNRACSNPSIRPNHNV